MATRRVPTLTAYEERIGADEADAAFRTAGEIQPASPVGLYATLIGILVIALLGIAIACLVLAVQMRNEVTGIKHDMKESGLLIATIASCACSCANLTQSML